MSKNQHINMPVNVNSKGIYVKCPNCRFTGRRVYKDWDNGFGFCRVCIDSNGKPIKLVRAGQIARERRLEERKERVQAELAGHYVRSNSNTHKYFST